MNPHTTSSNAPGWYSHHVDPGQPISGDAPTGLRLGDSAVVGVSPKLPEIVEDGFGAPTETSDSGLGNQVLILEVGDDDWPDVDDRLLPIAEGSLLDAQSLYSGDSPNQPRWGAAGPAEEDESEPTIESCFPLAYYGGTLTTAPAGCSYAVTTPQPHFPLTGAEEGLDFGLVRPDRMGFAESLEPAPGKELETPSDPEEEYVKIVVAQLGEAMKSIFNVPPAVRRNTLESRRVKQTSGDGCDSDGIPAGATVFSFQWVRCVEVVVATALASVSVAAWETQIVKRIEDAVDPILSYAAILRLAVQTLGTISPDQTRTMWYYCQGQRLTQEELAVANRLSQRLMQNALSELAADSADSRQDESEALRRVVLWYISGMNRSSSADEGPRERLHNLWYSAVTRWAGSLLPFMEYLGRAGADTSCFLWEEATTPSCGTRVDETRMALAHQLQYLATRIDYQVNDDGAVRGVVVPAGWMLGLIHWLGETEHSSAASGAAIPGPIETSTAGSLSASRQQLWYRPGDPEKDGQFCVIPEYIYNVLLPYFGSGPKYSVVGQFEHQQALIDLPRRQCNVSVHFEPEGFDVDIVGVDSRTSVLDVLKKARAHVLQHPSSSKQGELGEWELLLLYACGIGGIVLSVDGAAIPINALQDTMAAAVKAAVAERNGAATAWRSSRVASTVSLTARRLWPGDSGLGCPGGAGDAEAHAAAADEMADSTGSEFASLSATAQGVGSWKQGARGMSGLTNIGNTCYMNSALQCLSNMWPFRRALLSTCLSEMSSTPVTSAFASLLQAIWGGSMPVAPTRALKVALGQKERRFASSEQQDAIEYIEVLLDTIHEELNPVVRKKYRERLDTDKHIPLPQLSQLFWDNFMQNNDSVIPHLFFHQSKTHFRCLTCDEESTVFDNNATLSVAIGKAVQKVQVSVTVVFATKPLGRPAVRVVRCPTSQVCSDPDVSDENRSPTSQSSDADIALSSPESGASPSATSHEVAVVDLFVEPCNYVVTQTSVVIPLLLSSKPEEVEAAVRRLFRPCAASEEQTCERAAPSGLAALSKSYKPSPQPAERALCIDDEDTVSIAPASEVRLATSSANQYSSNTFYSNSRSGLGNQTVEYVAFVSKTEPEGSSQRGASQQPHSSAALNVASELQDAIREPRVRGYTYWYVVEDRFSRRTVALVDTQPSRCCPQVIRDAALTIGGRFFRVSDKRVSAELGAPPTRNVSSSSSSSISRRNNTLATESDEDRSPLAPIPDPYAALEVFVEAAGRLLPLAALSESLATADGPFLIVISGTLAFQLELEASPNVPSGLPLPLGHGFSHGRATAELNECIAAALRPEILDGDDTWYCPSCKAFMRSEVSRELFRLPPCLMVGLQRFEKNRFALRKDNSIVSFPTRLDLSSALGSQSPYSLSTHYQLRGVVYHRGTLDFGHYTAMCYNSEVGRWVYFDDSRVTPGEADEQWKPPEEDAFVLFYERVPAPSDSKL